MTFSSDSFERRGGLGGGELLDLAQHEHDAMIVPQPGDGSFQQLDGFPPRRPVFRPFVARTTRHLAHLHRELDGSDTLSAHEAQRDVQRDPDEPGAERRSSLERRERAVGLKIRLLHRVLDVGGIAAQQSADRAVDALVVAAHQDLERRDVAGENSANHVVVRHAARLEAFQCARYECIVVGAGILLGYARVFGWVAMGRILAIALNLVSSGRFLDVAARDVVMAAGAFALARLARRVETVSVAAVEPARSSAGAHA